MKRVKINHPDAKEIFINAIHDNQVIAYPTDTIYGLGTAMNNDEGIERINLMKMREQPMSIALGSFSVIKNHIIADENVMFEIKEILKADHSSVRNTVCPVSLVVNQAVSLFTPSSILDFLRFFFFWCRRARSDRAGWVARLCRFTIGGK